MRIRIHGGRLLDPSQGLDRVADLFIAEGRIAAVGEPPEEFRPDREIDAAGLLVLPGLVDLAARPREPGQEHKASITSESRAAAAGGITTLCCPPDTDPVIDEPAVVELIRSRAAQVGLTRMVALGALTRKLEGSQLAELAALKEAGCVGVSNALRPLAGTQILLRAMEYAATHRMTLHVQPQEHCLAKGGCAHLGAVAARMGLPGIPTAAETVAIATALALAEETGVRLHFGRLSSARGVELVAAAKGRGLPVTADVAAHQLFLTELELASFDANCHVLPPLRTARDRDALRAGVADGTIDAICSDHQPHDLDAKLTPFPGTEPGISALETLLPLTLRLVEEGALEPARAVECLTSRPAAILGLKAGRLEGGAPADVCLIDPRLPRRLDPARLASRGHNTPFGGWELRGRAVCTLLEGRVVYQNDNKE